MAEKFSRWDSADYLKSEEDYELYFEACLAEDPATAAWSAPRWAPSPAPAA